MNKKKFQSNEELYFSWYLDALKDRKYIDRWEVTEVSYELTKGLKHEYIKPMKRVEDKVLEQTILKPSSYNPDFLIYWNKKALGVFVSELRNTKGKINTAFICDEQLISVVETKGGFDMGNMTRLVINNIKFVYEKYNIYINLIKVPDIFKKTFTPDRYFMTDKTFKPRTIKFKAKTLSEFINQNK